MFRTFPVRTGIFTFGPLAVGLAQLLNAAIHGTAVVPVAAIAALMVVFSALITSYHLATFRRHTLTAGIVES